MGAKQLFRRDLRLPAIHPKKYFKIILDNKILNCYYQINTDSIPWRSVPSHRQPSECGPRDTHLGAFILFPGRLPNATRSDTRRPSLERFWTPDTPGRSVNVFLNSALRKMAAYFKCRSRNCTEAR